VAYLDILVHVLGRRGFQFGRDAGEGGDVDLDGPFSGDGVHLQPLERNGVVPQVYLQEASG